MKKSYSFASVLASGLLGLGLLTGTGLASAAPCSQCGVVQDIHSETQKGKATALGTVGGAVVGGILGNQVGKGDGNTVATIAGAVGGGGLGAIALTYGYQSFNNTILYMCVLSMLVMVNVVQYFGEWLYKKIL